MSFKHINYPIVEKTRPSMYRFMKYWGKKPHNIFRTYIEHYSKPNEIVLDAFSGIGICPLEAIQTNRKTIVVELNPVALFFMKGIGTLFNNQKFMMEFNNIYQKMINFEKEKKLFQTRCDCGKGGKIVCVHYESQKPKLIRYKCSCSEKYRSKKPDDEDILLINKTQNLKPEWWYPRDKFPESPTFNTIKDKAEYFYELWTSRVLYYLSFLYNLIEDIEDEHNKFFMKYAFASTLHLTTRMLASRSPKSERPDSGSWGRPAYFFPTKWREQNPFVVFERRIFNKKQGLITSKNSSNNLLGDKIKYAKDFNDLNNTNKNLLILKENTVELTKFIPKNSIDFVLTDPPYGDLIKYFDLSSLWAVWLKGKNQDNYFEIPYREEIIIHNIKSKEDLDYYESQMFRAFKQIYEVLREGRYMTLTFHNSNPKIYDTILKICNLCGFAFEKIIRQPNRRASESGVANPWGSAISDYYLIFRKPTKEEEVKDRLNKEGFERVVVETAKRVIGRRAQPTEFPFILDDIKLELYKFGEYFNIGTEENIANLLKSRIGREFVLWKDGKIIGDLKDVSNEKLKGAKWWLKEPDKVIKYKNIPLSDRIEKAIIQTLRKGIKASFDDVLQKLYETFTNSLTPATDGQKVKTLLKEYAEKTRRGMWILNRNFRKYESDHTLMIRFLAETGKRLGFEVYCPDRKKDEVINNLSEKDLHLQIGINKLNRIKQIDVIWFKNDKIYYIFEVENTTNFTDTLVRASNLPDVDSIKKIIVIPYERRNLLSRKLKEPMFEENFKRYDWRVTTYENIEKITKKKDFTLEEFDKIYSKTIRDKEYQTKLS